MNLNITELVDGLTEDEGIRLFHAMGAHFGWAGTVFTRADAQTCWQQQIPLHPGETEAGEMPDDFFDRLTTGYWWRRGIAERLSEIGWDFVEQAVGEEF